jgi:hypothetical protein
MLRRLNTGGLRLAHLTMFWVLACSPAAPVDVGIDYITPRPSPSTSSDAGDVTTPDQGAGGEPGDGSPLESIGDFVNSEWERGRPTSEYCRSSFQACGGLLAGSWEVEDNCNPDIFTREVLLEWGKARMDLDGPACFDAVKRLRWSWSGELSFVDGEAIDNRRREQLVEMQLTASCLSESFGLPRTDSVSPQVCEALEDTATTCALSAGVCICTNKTFSAGTASGTYGVLGLSVAIQEEPKPTIRYEYCVDQETDQLLWREKEGDQRHVVLRRTVTAAPGTVDPVEVPR